MNIFVTSQDPHHCAMDLDNKRLVKMVLETAQLLSTSAHVKLGTDLANRVGAYRPTHQNHPCAIWVSASAANLRWTVRLFKNYCHEYSFRYDRTHACEIKMKELIDVFTAGDGVRNIAEKTLEFANCTTFKNLPSILAYKEYLSEKWKSDIRKGHIPYWTHRGPPLWWAEKDEYLSSMMLTENVA